MRTGLYSRLERKLFSAILTWLGGEGGVSLGGGGGGEGGGPFAGGGGVGGGGGGGGRKALDHFMGGK